MRAAIQHNDGRIDDGAIDPVFAAPTIDLMTIVAECRPTDSGVSLKALRLADVLITAADEIEGWTNT
jgi:hypothetical protein